MRVATLPTPVIRLFLQTLNDFCADSWRLDCCSHSITMVAFTPARCIKAKIHGNEHSLEIPGSNEGIVFQTKRKVSFKPNNHS